jgi:hypothetical protein
MSFSDDRKSNEGQGKSDIHRSRIEGMKQIMHERIFYNVRCCDRVIVMMKSVATKPRTIRIKSLPSNTTRVDSFTWLALV